MEPLAEDRELHPYVQYLPKKPRLMIIGTFPIGKFTHPDRRPEIKPHEMDFFFGGEKNLLWKLLGDVFNRPVHNKCQAIELLEQEGIAMGDLIRACRRKGGGGSDSALYDIDWNVDLIQSIRSHQIPKIYFTSKKVESWFLKLFPDTDDLEKITLISPSAQSQRALYHDDEYLKWKLSHSDEKSYEYILKNYRAKFLYR